MAIVIDIKQRFVLSKWTKNTSNTKTAYRKKIDEKLDYDSATLTKGRMEKSIVKYILALLLPMESTGIKPLD
jgi:hypothetical protein